MAKIKPVEKKAWGWWILYLTLFIIGQQLAGLGGIIGAAIIAFGIHRTIRNPNYSRGKKILFIVLYIIGGLVVAILILMALLSIIGGIFGGNYISNVKSNSNIEVNYTAPVGFKTFESKNLELSALSYPSNWKATEDKANYQVVFESPAQNALITVTLYDLGEGKTFNMNTYTADIAKADQEEDSFSFQKTNEQIKTINGKKWLIFDGIISVPAQSYTASERIAIYVTGKYDGRQYLHFILETKAEDFAKQAEEFDKVIESARFYS
ncbi:hypothetical protein FJZ18_02185 [Candidatus Pacearchaeota archaeon]|nr:hypothetical protein [Candidatus Pacearchaeota archaeon]